MELIRQNLPALIVIGPLCMGLLTALLGRGLLGWLMALMTCAGAAGAAAQLLFDVQSAGTLRLSYMMGNWPAPFGIEYAVDPLNAAVLLVVALLACVITLQARRGVAAEIPPDRARFFWALWQFCLCGLLGITITGDAFNLYVLLEVSSLSTYTLVAMGKERDRRALTAAIHYLVLGTMGACFYLLGVAYLYMATGSLNMADMAGILAQKIYPSWSTSLPLYHNTVIAGFALIAVGLSLKLALFPLHLWLPRAYTYAPSAVSALLAATATKVGAYALIRVIYTLVGTWLAFEHLPTRWLLIGSALLAILVGSYFAIRQSNVKMLLAWSSVAQVGYIALGFSLGNLDGLRASIIHIFNHALTKGGMFMALACVAWRAGGVRMEDLRGLGRRMPLTMAAFTVGGLGLVGVPLTAGFVSKWYLVAGALDAGLYAAAGVALLGSLLALVYVWRCVEQAYFQPRPEGAPDVREAPPGMVLPVLLMIGASVYFGVDARLSSEIATAAAVFLLGAAP